MKCPCSEGAANTFLNSVTVIHEPDSIWYQCNGGCAQWTPTTSEQFISNTSSAIKLQASNVLTGAAVESDNANGLETVYWNNWLISVVPGSVDYLGIDLYGN